MAYSLPLTDRAAITELTARYAFYVDTFQIDPLMELFAADDPVMDETNAGLGRHEGQDGIRRYFADDLFPKVSALVHLTGNHILDEVAEDRVRGKCSVILDGDLKGGGTIHGTCWYDDTYVRTGQGWKFASRIVTPYTELQIGSLAGGNHDG